MLSPAIAVSKRDDKTPFIVSVRDTSLAFYELPLNDGGNPDKQFTLLWPGATPPSIVGGIFSGLFVTDVDADADDDIWLAMGPYWQLIENKDTLLTFSMVANLELVDNPDGVDATNYRSQGTMADLDGDEVSDLVIAHEQGLSVWVQGGNHVYSSRADILINQAVYAVAAGDIDGDGDNDLVSVDADGFDFWENDGSGAFVSKQHIAAWDDGLVDYDVAGVVIADINNDGVDDAILGESQSQFWVYSPETMKLVQTGNSLQTPFGFFFVDVDADGDVDIVPRQANCNDASDIIPIYRADGKGDFVEVAGNFTDKNTQYIVDLNDDGFLDEVVPSGVDLNAWALDAGLLVSRLGITGSGDSKQFIYEFAAYNNGAPILSDVALNINLMADITDYTLTADFSKSCVEQRDAGKLSLQCVVTPELWSQVNGRQDLSFSLTAKRSEVDGREIVLDISTPLDRVDMQPDNNTLKFTTNYDAPEATDSSPGGLLGLNPWLALSLAPLMLYARCKQD